jgi:integrase
VPAPAPAHRRRPERKEAAYFENDELPRLFAHLNDASANTLCLVALKTGMRQGELFALRWVMSISSRQSSGSDGATQEVY